jgi:DNA-binding CsgD family transcriptional regulator/PAS domain-containing protein
MTGHGDAVIETACAAPAPTRAFPRMRLDADELDLFLNSIYEGAEESPPWQKALKLMQDSFDAAHVTLILRPPSPNTSGVLLNTREADPNATAFYQHHFFAFDPFVDLPTNTVVTPQEMLGDRWNRSPMLRDYLLPLDVEHLVGADIRTREGVECRFRISRYRGARPFDAEDRTLCKFLLPHLTRSIQLRTMLDNLDCEREVVSGTVTRMLVGVLSLSAEGQIINANPEALRILGEADGLRQQHGRLLPSRPGEARALRMLIRTAALPDAIHRPLGAMAITRPSGRCSLSIVIRPVPGSRSAGQQHPAMAVFLRDPESCVARSALDVVRRLYGLSRMEASVAMALGDGLTLDETAEKFGITRNTARTYLRIIFCKTGVTRQTMLVRKLLNSVATLGC